MRRKCAEDSILAGRKEAFSNQFSLLNRANIFKINTNLPTVGNSIECQPVRVGYVEAERFPSTLSAELGLSIWTVAKSNLIWFYLEISAQDVSEQPTGCDKVLTVFLEVITLRPSQFFCGQGLL